MLENLGWTFWIIVIDMPSYTRRSHSMHLEDASRWLIDNLSKLGEVIEKNIFDILAKQRWKYF